MKFETHSGLKGHAALVTGSSQGVGAGIAEALAAAGADVVVHAREPEAGAREVAERCRAHGVQAACVFHDLLGPVEAGADELLGKALGAHAGLDLLVNNAGGFFDAPYLEISAAGLEKTLRLNVVSAYFLTQRFARHWVARGVGGRVVFTGSVNGILAERNSTAYDVSKGAVEMLVRSLAVALAPHGIRVNGMAPGFVATPLSSRALARPGFREWLALHTPNGEVPPAAVCGPAVAFLLSDAAAHICGHMLRVDGGISAWQHPPPPKL